MLLLFAVIIAIFGLDVMFNVFCFYIKLLDVRICCIHIINFYAAFHGIQDTRLSWLLASWLISEVTRLLCYYVTIISGPLISGKSFKYKVYLCCCVLKKSVMALL